MFSCDLCGRDVVQLLGRVGDACSVGAVWGAVLFLCCGAFSQRSDINKLGFISGAAQRSDADVLGALIIWEIRGCKDPWSSGTAPIGWSSGSSAVGLGCGWCCAEPGVGLGDPWGSLPTQNVLWFCVKCLSLTWREKGHNWLHSCLSASQIAHDWGLGERQSWQQPGPFWMSWDAWWWC